MNAVWSTEHSVETKATTAFVWNYMTQVENWDDPPATFRLDGPFADGSQGVTQFPGTPPRVWQLRNLKPPERYTIEFALDGAVLSFEWQFYSLGDSGARLTQRVVLLGENAAAYLLDVQPAFASNLAPGMSRVASAIDRAYDAHLQLDRMELPSERKP